eukprot:scaffold38944_cov63-Phaeocystis_antarctica.AAC.5
MAASEEAGARAVPSGASGCNCSHLRPWVPQRRVCTSERREAKAAGPPPLAPPTAAPRPHPSRAGRAVRCLPPGREERGAAVSARRTSTAPLPPRPRSDRSTLEVAGLQAASHSSAARGRDRRAPQYARAAPREGRQRPVRRRGRPRCLRAAIVSRRDSTQRGRSAVRAVPLWCASVQSRANEASWGTVHRLRSRPALPRRRAPPRHQAPPCARPTIKEEGLPTEGAVGRGRWREQRVSVREQGVAVGASEDDLPSAATQGHAGVAAPVSRGCTLRSRALPRRLVQQGQAGQRRARRPARVPRAVREALLQPRDP